MKTLKIIALYILMASLIFVLALAVEAIEGGKGAYDSYPY